MKFVITDQDSDDWARNVVAVRLTRDDGKSLTWKVPKRLMQREGMASIVMEELEAELKETWKP